MSSAMMRDREIDEKRVIRRDAAVQRPREGQWETVVEVMMMEGEEKRWISVGGSSGGEGRDWTGGGERAARAFSSDPTPQFSDRIENKIFPMRAGRVLTLVGVCRDVCSS